MNADYLLRTRGRFAGSLRKTAAQNPPRAETDLDAMADALTAIVEGAIILAKALDDPGLMGRQVRLFRSHVKLLFGA